jgi:hypothetical protein
LLVLTALGIRAFIPRGLWLDEAISVEQAHLGLPALIQNLAGTDYQPPLHHVVLWVVMRLAGDDDLAVRVPSIAAGILLVPVTYWLAAELFDRRTGIVAAALATFAPILVWYSQEAGGYALETLFCTTAVLGCARIVRRGGRDRDWALHAAAATLAVWTSWFALLVVAATEAVLVVELVRRRRAGIPLRAWVTGWIASSVALTVQLAALGMLAASQVRATGAGGGYAGTLGTGDGLSFYTIASNVSWALLGFHEDAVTQALSAIWPMLMLAALVLVGRGMSRRGALLLVCAAGPVVGVLVLGLVSPPAFDVRYFVAAVPGALVLFARLGTAWPRTRHGRAAVVGAMALLFAVALVDQQRNRDNPRRYDFREALATAQARMGPRDVLLYQPPELRFILNHYAPDLVARPLDGRLPTRREAPGVLVIGSFLDQPRYGRVADRQLRALRAARRPAGRERFPGVTLWTFR